MNNKFEDLIKNSLDKNRLLDDEGNAERNLIEYKLIEAVIFKKIPINIPDLSNYVGFTPEKVLENMYDLRFSLFRGKIIFRKKFTNLMRKFIRDFLNLMNFENSQLSAFISYSDYSFKEFIQRPRRPSISKIVLIGFALSPKLKLPDEIKRNLLEICLNINYGRSRYVLKRIYDAFYETYKESIQKLASSNQNFEGNGTPIDESVDIENKDESEVPQEKNELFIEIERLKERIAELESSNEFILLRNEDLVNEIQKLNIEGKKKAELELFREFNKIENNFLLNSFYKAHYTNQLLKSGGWVPDRPELKGILFFFEQLEEFFNRRGVTSQYKIGEILNVKLNEVSQFDYIGSEFESDQEVKTVKVRMPAWCFNNIQITKAEVIEIPKAKEEDTNVRQ